MQRKDLVFFPAEKGGVQQEAGICFNVFESYRIQEALLHKYLIFPAALVFLSVGIREVVQMCVGTTLAVRRDCFAHHIHWTLESAMALPLLC